MTPREIGAEALLRVRRSAAHKISRVKDRPDSTYITDDEFQSSLNGKSLAAFAGQIRRRAWPHLTSGLADLARTVEVIKQLFPDAVEVSRREADPILDHQIKLFDRRFDLGPQIDWHADPATGARWPLEHHTRVPIQIERGADARVVWELNRLHHFVTLGRAYALTGDERYTEEFLIQFASWYEENPPRFGVNWTVAMEVAIRAINLIAAMELFRFSKVLSSRAIELILKTLIAHGRFIRSNLEFSHRVTSNHYLSNLIGLFCIGMILPGIRESREWVSFSAPRLIAEMEKQVFADGVNYEGATGYHRLVLEIFTAFFAPSRASGIELPDSFSQRLEAMFDFARYYLKPDGTAPLIGDSDDGRLIRFKDRPAVDHSYLMPIAAVLFESERFKASDQLDEETLWWFGEAGREKFESLPVNEEEPGSRGFPDSQIFIQRGGPLYAIIDCGDHGAGGRGSHAHSDALSIEVFACGTTFLRDPGTFVYTASELWRNRFRSTAYHNTVRIDGRDISPIKRGELFTLGANVRPQLRLWESDAERDLLDAMHFGYADFDEPVIHRRAVTFDKREGYWIIHDYFAGSGAHLFEFFFNFDAGLDVQIESDLRAIARSESSALAIAPASGHSFETKMATRWVSLSYGTRARASGIIYRLRAGVPFENVFLIVPYAYGDESKVEQAIGDEGATG